MAKTAAHLVECVIPRVPARQWVLSFPIPLRSLFAVHPELLAAEPKIYSFSPKTQPPIALGNLLAIARAGLTVSDDLHYRLSGATHPYLAEPFHI